jgi:hypothetical protein
LSKYILIWHISGGEEFLWMKDKKILTTKERLSDASLYIMKGGI